LVQPTNQLCCARAGGKGSAAGGGESLFSATYRKGVLMGCLLFVFQQFSGINAIVYFSSSVFKQVQRETRRACVNSHVHAHTSTRMCMRMRSTRM
jgi:hypothetical protein